MSYPLLEEVRPPSLVSQLLEGNNQAQSGPIRGNEAIFQTDLFVYSKLRSSQTGAHLLQASRLVAPGLWAPWRLCLWRTAPSVQAGSRFCSYRAAGQIQGLSVRRSSGLQTHTCHRSLAAASPGAPWDSRAPPFYGPCCS